jgi:hypothetical protein
VIAQQKTKLTSHSPLYNHSIATANLSEKPDKVSKGNP